MSVAAITAIGAPGPTGPAAEPELEHVKRAAREFEALFLLQMLKQMRQSMLEETPNGEGLGAATMFDTIDSELARHLAGHGPMMQVLVEAFGGGRPVEMAPAAVPAAAPIQRPTVTSPAPEGRPVSVPAGTITSAFGERVDPLGGGKRFHQGIDVRAAYGTEVPSAADGRVVFAGTARGYGQLITIEHAGGIQTRYAHLSEIAVRQGDVVPEGAIIGRVGQSGRATGPHLHFEVRQDGRPVDPVRFAGRYAGRTQDAD